MKLPDKPLIERLRCDGTLLCRPAYDPTYLCTRCEGAEALQAAEDELTRFREWHASYDALGITGLVELLTAAEAKVERLTKIIVRYHAGQVANVEQLLAAEAKLAAIDALHRPRIAAHPHLCDGCSLKWPCPTHRILHPEEEQ